MFEFKGKFLCDERFLKYEPLDMLHKESDDEAERRLREAHPQELCNVHVLFEHRFECDPESFDKILLRFSADDTARVFVNGTLAAIGPCPGYPFRYYFNEIDISSLLESGKNTVGAEVVYTGLISRADCSADLRMGFVADIVGVNNGGETLLEATDESWKHTVLKTYTSDRKIGAGAAFCDDYDSRLEPRESDWKNCVSKQTDYVFYPAPTLQIYSRKPVICRKLENGGFFYDMGTELTGTVRLCAVGHSGDKVKIYCGEETDSGEVGVRFHMRCCGPFEDTWTLAEGECTFEQFYYKGFRYFAVVPDSGIEIKDVSVTVRHNEFDDGACTVESNSEVLNKVFEICKNGVKYGSQDVYVDCPQREKGQYAGDSTVTTASSLWLTGDGRLMKKAMEDQAASAVVCKGLMAVAPGNEMQEIADYSFQYPILALRYYEFAHDKDFLRQNYETCLGIKEYSRRFVRQDGLIQDLDDKGNLVDWPKNLRDGYDFEWLDASPNPGARCGYAHNVINAFYVGFLYGVEEIEKILGITPSNEASKAAEAFNKIFLDRETGLYVDSEKSSHSSVHSNMLPLYYGFVPEAFVGGIADFIAEKKLCCGVYMAYFLLKALAKAGRYEDVWNLITSEDENSWYNMVREGATTCFEAWGKEKKWNTSLCHPWASAPVSVLFEDICGLGLDGSKGESRVPKGISLKIKTPIHGEMRFDG